LAVPVCLPLPDSQLAEEKDGNDEEDEPQPRITRGVAKEMGGKQHLHLE
jgi:hypothetical protein